MLCRCQKIAWDGPSWIWRIPTILLQHWQILSVNFDYYISCRFNILSETHLLLLAMYNNWFYGWKVVEFQLDGLDFSTDSDVPMFYAKRSKLPVCLILKPVLIYYRPLMEKIGTLNWMPMVHPRRFAPGWPFKRWREDSSSSFCCCAGMLIFFIKKLFYIPGFIWRSFRVCTSMCIH